MAVLEAGLHKMMQVLTMNASILTMTSSPKRENTIEFFENDLMVFIILAFTKKLGFVLLSHRQQEAMRGLRPRENIIK